MGVPDGGGNNAEGANHEDDRARRQAVESVNDVYGIHQTGNGKDRKGDRDEWEPQQFVSDREFKACHAVTRKEAERQGGYCRPPQAQNRPRLFPKVLTAAGKEG